jgi:hypothetical protein
LREPREASILPEFLGIKVFQKLPDTIFSLKNIFKIAILPRIKARISY